VARWLIGEGWHSEGQWLRSSVYRGSGQWLIGPGGCFFGPYGIGNDAEYRAAMRQRMLLSPFALSSLSVASSASAASAAAASLTCSSNSIFEVKGCNELCKSNSFVFII
jgi:hypothetical protein